MNHSPIFIQGTMNRTCSCGFHCRWSRDDGAWAYFKATAASGDESYRCCPVKRDRVSHDVEARWESRVCAFIEP